MYGTGTQNIKTAVSDSQLPPGHCKHAARPHCVGQTMMLCLVYARLKHQQYKYTIMLICTPVKQRLARRLRVWEAQSGASPQPTSCDYVYSELYSSQCTATRHCGGFTCHMAPKRLCPQPTSALRAALDTQQSMNDGNHDEIQGSGKLSKQIKKRSRTNDADPNWH